MNIGEPINGSDNRSLSNGGKVMNSVLFYRSFRANIGKVAEKA
jgi:hypothetical protein